MRNSRGEEMTKKAIAIGSVGIIACFFIAMGLAVSVLPSQTSPWKGKIETVDGVKVVRNPNEPFYGNLKMDLAADLTIGRADDDNYLLNRVRDIEVDLEGSIYIADLGNFRVQKFDKNGKYLLTFGRKGQGPGEFDLPIKVRLDESTGNIAVQDQVYTIEYFASDGKPLKSVRLANAFFDFRISPNGTVFAIIGTQSDLNVKRGLGKISEQGQVEKIYAEFPYNLFVQKMGEGMMSISTGHELSLLFNRLGEESLIYGYSRNYELTVADFDGNTRFRIAKDEPPPKFTDKEKSGFRKIPLPEAKPYFYALFTDDLGRIYVQRNQAGFHVKDDIQKELDVFSKDGYFLYRTKLPKDMYVIRNGYVYACEVGDEEIIKRYKIKNWDTMKASADGR
jgi:hypothetical protein